jgi:hypothetical protein
MALKRALRLAPADFKPGDVFNYEWKRRFWYCKFCGRNSRKLKKIRHAKDCDLNPASLETVK